MRDRWPIGARQGRTEKVFRVHKPCMGIWLPTRRKLCFTIRGAPNQRRTGKDNNMSSKTEPELTLNITPQAYSPEYRQVMDAAFSLAKGSKEHIVRVADLLEALPDYPGAIENVLGKTSLTYPVHSAEEVESTEQIVFSSETDRTLSMQGGSMEEVMTSLRHPATIDVIHLAAALFLHPGGPILEFLNVNGLSPSDTGYAPRILAVRRRIRRPHPRRRTPARQRTPAARTAGTLPLRHEDSPRDPRKGPW